jgi:hypothetical protein
MDVILKRYVIACLCVAGFLVANRVCGGDSWKIESLTDDEKACFERAARTWAAKLWTNDYSGCVASFDARRYNFRPWTTYVDVAFRLNGKLCICEFVDRDPAKFMHIRNHSYANIINYSGEKIHGPVHTTKEQARARAAEYAAFFGVSNLWDTSKFSAFNTIYNPSKKCWEYGLSSVRNGYLCPYGVSVSIADLPGAPLYSWHNALNNIPPGLPTNVVLNAEQAQAKALEYMKKYFPFQAAALYRGQVLEKGDKPEMKCYTNRLEYVIPDYNYIRPAPGRGGLSNYVAKKDEIALAWANDLGTTEDSKYDIGATIYVDAATGEMLGGSD